MPAGGARRFGLARPSGLRPPAGGMRPAGRAVRVTPPSGGYAASSPPRLRRGVGASDLRPAGGAFLGGSAYLRFALRLCRGAMFYRCPAFRSRSRSCRFSFGPSCRGSCIAFRSGS